MSTRPVKKRKGRGNYTNRERTVTTLTEGTEGSFTAAEDPQANLMSSPFSVASSSTGPTSTVSPSFQIPPSFSNFSYNRMPSMQGSPITGPTFAQQQPPAHFYSAQSIPPGENDLEILERLKDTIKNGQHEFFRPVPRPTALAQVYLGPHNGSHVPPHPEQIPHEPPMAHPQNGRHERSQSNASVSDTRKTQAGVTNKAPGTTTEAIDTAGKSMDIDPPGLNTPVVGLDKSQRPPHDSGAPGASSKYDPRGLSRSGTDKSLGEHPPSTAGLDNKDDTRDTRNSSWAHRNGNGSQDDLKNSRYDHDKYGPNGRPHGDSRYNDNARPGVRYARDYDREKDRERDREREREQRDRDWERDRRGTDLGTRYRDERRTDERFRYGDNRRPPPDQRHYEPRHESKNDPLRRWDSKSSNESAAAPAIRPVDERPGPPADTHAPRPLGEERSFEVRDPRVPEDRPFDSRGPRPLGEDRTFDARGARPLGEERSFEHRGPRPANDDRSYHSRLHSLDDRDPRDRRPLGERPLVPVTEDERASKVVDDRRPPPLVSSDRLGRLDDDRRAPPPAPHERQTKPTAGDRRVLVASSSVGDPAPVDRLQRPPASSDDRRIPPPSQPPPMSASARPLDDRRQPPAPTTERSRPPTSVSGSDRTARAADEYNGRPAPLPSTDASASTTSTVRTQTQDDRHIPRPPVPLEERIGRQASLQERLSIKPVEPVSGARADDRPSRPAPLSEQRAPGAPSDERSSRPGPELSEDRRAGNARPTSDAASNARPVDSRVPPSESHRPPVSADRSLRPDERGRPLVNDRLPRGSTPAGDRGPSHVSGQNQPYAHPSPRPMSWVRDDPLTKARGPTVSPRRAEFRPSERPGYPDRYERERSRERRAEAMDVDSSARLPDRAAPPSYRRTSPAPSYNRSDRPWPPPGEAYAARHPLDPPPSATSATYGRDWREEDRTGIDDWERRNWDRDRLVDRERDYDRERDPRYIDREPHPPGWETREERDRRVPGVFPPSDVPPPARPYDARPPLTSRLADGYPVDDRSYDRSRYPEPSTTVAPRVRPRSPSPSRRVGGLDDLRPPLKRPRDDAYASGYPPPSGLDAAREYPPARLRTPPPPASVSQYYDDTRVEYPRGASPSGPPRDRERDRTYPDREDYGTYDRRDALPSGRAPPRSPGPYARSYARDDRRYGLPPPRP